MKAGALVVSLWLMVPAIGLAQASDPEGAEEEVQSSEEATTRPATTPPPATRRSSTPRSSTQSSTSSPTPPPRAAGSAGAPAMPQPASPARAEEEEEEEDGGDPYDFLWIDVAGGVSYVDLRALNADNYYPEFVRLSGIGPAGSVAAGFRIEFLSIGVRGSIAHYSDEFDVGTATAEISLALPIPVVKPYLRVGFGLGWHGDGDFNAPTNSQTTVFGFAFSGAVGIDIYLADWFSIGAAGTLDILNMSRQSLNDPVDPADAGTVEFTETGDAVGIQARGHAGVTFHL